MMKFWMLFHIPFCDLQSDHYSLSPCEKQKYHLRLHLLLIYHVVMRSQLIYIIRSKVQSLRKLGSAAPYTRQTHSVIMSSPGYHLAKTARFSFLDGSGTEQNSTPIRILDQSLVLQLSCHHTVSIQHLLPSIILSILIGLDQLSFCLIETQPCGRAKRCHNRSLLTLTLLKMMYHAKTFIARAMHLFMKR
jgi:hypothetical protein